jgi:hypothetical protein
MPPHLREYALAYLTALEAVAAIFSQHAGKCPDLARALDGAAAQRDSLKAASNAAAHQATSADTELSRRLDEASRAIADGSMGCAKSAAFIAARNKLLATDQPR